MPGGKPEAFGRGKLKVIAPLLARVNTVGKRRKLAVFSRVKLDTLFSNITDMKSS